VEAIVLLLEREDKRNFEGLQLKYWRICHSWTNIAARLYTANNLITEFRPLSSIKEAAPLQTETATISTGDGIFAKDRIMFCITIYRNHVIIDILQQEKLNNRTQFSDNESQLDIPIYVTHL
jgi:hypothetical protein